MQHFCRYYRIILSS